MVSTDALIGLHGQGQAGPNDIPIHAHRAGPADPVLATDMRPGQMQVLAQEVRKIEARQNLRERQPLR